MSHSAFRILANDESTNRNLVIVVNKNGQVATDTKALQTLLTSKGNANTGISIVRESSPTPSISDEMEQERIENYESKRQELLLAHADEQINEEELENQMKLISRSIKDEIPHVTLSVENFYPPDQARKFANDVLHLGGIDNPQTLMPIDFNFRRQIIQNDHCYTPLLFPEGTEKSQLNKISETMQNKQTLKKVPSKARPQVVENYSSDSGEALQEDEEEYEEEQSGEEEDISFSESDDDNDIDFSVNDRFGKKGKKKRKYRKHKQKNLTFKDFLETGDVPQMDEEPKRKYIKSLKKTQLSRPSTSGKIVTVSSIKNTQQTSNIKKNLQANTALVFKNISVRTEATAHFVPLTENFTKSSTIEVPEQILVHSSQPIKSKQEIEFVESIVKDLEKSFPENDKEIRPCTIPNIMQMMETTTPPEIIDQSLSSLEQLDSGDGTEGIEEIGDALIAALGNEAIDELLNQNVLINFEPTLKISQNQGASTMQNSLQVMSEASTSSYARSTYQIKVLNKQPSAKDPIKFMRNGRVITLPPIEAPTTRGAKRRAEGDSPNSSLLFSSIGKVAKTEKSSSNKDSDSRNSSRCSSLNKSDSGKSSRRQSIIQTVAADDELDDLNSDGSWASEDDPDRLWCICSTPHNNRFMICCDKCEDWFHGQCVNVSKAMGKEIELMGKEWSCPNCRATGGPTTGVKKIGPSMKPKQQQKLTKFFAKSQKESTDEDIAKTLCIVCKEHAARDSSIYCSDECIQNSATKLIDDTKSSESTPKRGNVLKDKSGNVIVMDKTTGKVLQLSRSPHFTNLGQWLLQNTNYEPVKPGSSQAEQILSRNKNQSQPQTPTSITTSNSPVKPLMKSISAEDLFSNPVKINTGASPNATKKPSGQQSGNSGSTRNVGVKNTSSSGGVKQPSASLKSPNVTSASSKHATPKHELKRIKHQVTETSSNNPSSKTNIEKDRMNIRKILEDTLKKRMQEFDHPEIHKMTKAEITEFVKETEREMYLFFNKEVRDKYKAKYRSLKFNLSDVKNKTLLEKICGKKITPKILVELQPADLASEELSKWREEEKKHQLEIITKSELDALAQNKIVLKTHKGEEIIETKLAPLDIFAPIIEDVESAIEKTVLNVEDPHGRYDLARSYSLNISGGNISSPLSSPSISSSTGRKLELRHRSRSRSKSKGRDRHHHHHHKSSSSKHKKSERQRSRSPRQHSSRETQKSRERSKSRKLDSHKNIRDRSKSKETDKSASTPSKFQENKTKELKIHVKNEKADSKILDIQPDQQDVDLVGKILNSMGVHLDKPSSLEVNKEKMKIEDTKSNNVKSPLKHIPPASTESAPEAMQQIEIYSGNMNMAGVASFNVSASIVSGNFDDISKSFPAQLEAVGRIDRKSAIDYLDKAKKFPGKELCILRFTSTDEISYAHFFDYLNSMQKYGVIKLQSPKVKDFYLFTLKSGESLPNVLLPLKGPRMNFKTINEGSPNPDILLGVILKTVPEIKPKKLQPSLKKLIPKTNRTQINFENQLKHKSHSSKLTIGLPEFPRSAPNDKNNDDDESPYNPFEEDESLNVSNYNLAENSGDKSGNVDLESEMEIINREIEQRQMEIQTLSKQKAMELNVEQATRIYENISVPHNLSEILSTITKNETKPMSFDNNDEEDEYVPTTIRNLDYLGAGYSAMSQPVPIVNSMMDIDERQLFHSPSEPDSPSRLANMTDADLMKLVPDGALEAPPPPKISNQHSIPGLNENNFDQ